MITAYPWFFKLLIWVIPTLTAVSWRESIKVWMCHFRGDSTAKMVGLGSFSFRKNLDPVGSAIAPVLMILRHQIDVYAWAKSTEIRGSYLNRGTQDVILVVCTGILANYIMAIGWAWIEQLGHIVVLTHPKIAEVLMIAGDAGVHINLLLVLIHLLPLPPTDCSMVIRNYMPRYIKAFYTAADPIGHYLIFAAFFLKIAQPYFDPIHTILINHLYQIAGLSNLIV